MSTTANPRLEAALACARRGWAVLPVWGVRDDGTCACGNPHERDERTIGKHPLGRLVAHGVKEATTDEATVRGWWSREPGANLAVATGERSDLLVLDVDGEDGQASLRRLEAEHGELPGSVEQITGGGGSQIFFRHAAGLRNAVKFAPGLDVRTDGGYAIVPPSRHRTGRPYEWDACRDPEEAPIADAPSWFVSLLPKRAAGVPQPSGATAQRQPAGDAEGARRYLGRVEGAVSGQRGHARTFRVACLLLHRFHLGAEQAFALLSEWNARCLPPWTEKELRHKLASAEQAPRRPTPPRHGDLPRPPPIAEISRRLYRGDDAEVARLLLDALRQEGQDLVHDEGRIHRYDAGTGLWAPIEPYMLRRTVSAMAGLPVGEPSKALKVKLPLVNGAVVLACDEVHVQSFFAQAPRGIAFANGFLHLVDEGLAFGRRDPGNRARWGYEFDYDPRATCPRWLQFLAETFDGAEDRGQRVACLQEFAGACVLGIAPRYQAALVALGSGENGKGVALGVLSGLMPPGTVCAIAPQTWGHEYRLAKMAGKLLNVVNELPELELLDTEAIKCVIAGDPTTARHIREAPFDLIPTAGHIFAANRLPRTSDSSHGFWRRWIVLPFDRVVPAQAKVPDLARVILREERRAIVNWALGGAERLIAQRAYTVPSSSQEALEAWRGDADPIRCFLRERARVVAPGRTGALGSAVHAAYRAFCKENGYRTVAANLLGSRLRSMGFGPKHTAQGNMYPFAIGGEGDGLFEGQSAGDGR